jgi:hypothetical protein
MKILVIMAMLLSLAVVLAACDKEAMYQDTIAKAIATTVEARSFRATVNQIILLDSHVSSSSYEVEFVAPDRWHSLFTLIADGGGDVREGVDQDTEARCPGEWHEIIELGNTSYVREWNRPEWTAMPGLAHVQTLGGQLARYKFLVDVEKLPDEEIRGVTCSHYRGRVDQEAYVDMMKEEIEGYGEEDTPEYSQYLESTRGDERFVDLWIDENDYIRQIEVRSRFFGPLGNRLHGFMIARYFDYNEDMDISAPSDALPPPWPTPPVTPWPTPTMSPSPIPPPMPPHTPPLSTQSGTT